MPQSTFDPRFPNGYAPTPLTPGNQIMWQNGYTPSWWGQASASQAPAAPPSIELEEVPTPQTPASPKDQSRVGGAQDPRFDANLEEVAPGGYSPFDSATALKDTLRDVAHAAGSGLVRGAAGVPGLPGDIIDLIQRGHDWWTNKRAGAPDAWSGGRTYLPTSQDVIGAVDRAIPGTQAYADYQPTTRAGKFAETVASFVPGAATGGANAANLVRYAVVPGLLSEGAGQAAEAYDPNNKALATGARIAGGLLGAVGGRKITSPLENTGEAAAQRATDVRYLREQGVYPHPGQVGDAKTASFLYDELNPERYKPIRDAFTRAAMRQAGVDGLATVGPGGNIPRVMAEASRRYDRAIARSGPMQADRPLERAIYQRWRDVNAPGLYGDDVRTAVNGASVRVAQLAAANRGAIPARDYQSLRSDIAEQARGMTDPRGKRFLYGLVDDLDSAMERHLTRTGRDPAMFRQAADYYKRMLTLREAADSAGAATAAGHITPANLQRAAESVYGTESRMQEDNPFARLARAGVNVLGEAKSSGTAERMGVKMVLALPGAAGLASVGHLLGAAGVGEHAGLGTILGLEPAMAGLGAAGSKMALRPLLDNPVSRRYIGNQLAQGVNSGPLAARGYVPGLLTANQATQPATREPLHVTVHPSTKPRPADAKRRDEKRGR